MLRIYIPAALTSSSHGLPHQLPRRQSHTLRNLAAAATPDCCGRGRMAAPLASRLRKRSPACWPSPLALSSTPASAHRPSTVGGSSSTPAFSAGPPSFESASAHWRSTLGGSSSTPAFFAWAPSSAPAFNTRWLELRAAPSGRASVSARCVAPECPRLGLHAPARPTERRDERRR